MGRDRISKTAAAALKEKARAVSTSSPTSSSGTVELPRRQSSRLRQSKINVVILGRNNVLGKGKQAAPKRRSCKLLSTSSVEEVEITEPEPQNVQKRRRLQRRRVQTKEEMLKELIAFDLDSAFGPSCGISRFERLDRAMEFGLCAEEGKLERLRENLETLLAAEKEAKQEAQVEQCLWDHPTLYANY